VEWQVLYIKLVGPCLEKECRPLVPIQPGEAVITGGHQLPNDCDIHCLGLVYGRDQPEDQLLANCYRKALQIAEDKKINYVAFPAISTAAFGFPTKEATKITSETISDVIPELNAVKTIRFVLFDDKDLEIHQDILSDLKALSNKK